MVKKEKPKKEKQLDLGLKQSPKNIFYKFKLRFTKFLIRFEIKEFLRSPFTWLVVILSLSFIITQGYVLFENISSYPSELPIWQNQVLLSRRLMEKNFLYIFPSISIFTLIIGIFLSNIYYHKEKFLSKILLFSVLLSVMSLTFAFLKLIP